MLKPQDILVLLKLALPGQSGQSVQQLGTELGLSASEVHQALKRARKAGLVRFEGEGRGRGGHDKLVRRAQLLELLVHGVKYMCPPEYGGETRGMPTLWAATPLNEYVAAPTDALPLVWPDAEGEVRGLELKPLYASAVQASRKDPALYELLVLLDAIRAGQARERDWAKAQLKERIQR